MVVRNKEGRSGGRPQEERWGRTPAGGILEAGEAGTGVLLESGLGARGGHGHAAVFKADNQQGPTV